MVLGVAISHLNCGGFHLVGGGAKEKSGFISIRMTSGWPQIA